MIYLAGFLAYFIKGLCGFANTLVFQSVLRISDTSLNMNITPLECLLSWPFNLLMTWHKRAYLKLKRVAGLIVLVLGGAVIGVFLLKNLHGAWLNRLFGITVIAIALDLLFLKKKSDPDSPLLKVIGFLSSILCGLFGVGAFLAAYMNRVSDSSDEFKANLSAVFIFENSFRLLLYALNGMLSAAILKQVLFCLPVSLLGLYAGIKCSQFVSEKTAKIFVLIALFVSGLYLLFV